jgi:tRNA modification GTPase
MPDSVARCASLFPTIAALATPPGRGGIGVIRVSGPGVPAIAQGVLGRLPAPRHAGLADFLDAEGRAIDQGLALYFPAPHSFTGEAVLELQGHGGTVVMDLLLRRVLELGARLARPGEFSERAFLNGKIDLAQAEAIADLIDSASQQAARCALHSLQGEFSRKIHGLVENLWTLRSYVEAGIDFPDEEIDLLADGQVTARIRELDEEITAILGQAEQGFLLREGMHLVIVGAPNVGKSSLLNALAGRETAIVTDIAGTTRDIVRDSIHLDGMPLHITDTAGLRETLDPVEQEGIRRAREALKSADLALILLDGREPATSEAVLCEELPAGCKVLVVRNKCDLSGQPAGFAGEVLHLSAKTGAGLDELRGYLKKRMGFHGESGQFMARQRHLDALEGARAALHLAARQSQARHGELVAEELRQAQQALGEITGEVRSEDLLARIFSGFCIGK